MRVCYMSTYKFECPTEDGSVYQVEYNSHPTRQQVYTLQVSY